MKTNFTIKDLEEAFDAGQEIISYDWHINEFHGTTCDCESPDYKDFKEYKKFIEENELVENELDTIGADIRNKLSPLKNLIALLEEQKKVDNNMKKKIQVYIDREMEQGKKSIDYLRKLL